MNEYNIIFSMFLIVEGNKISTKNHFSNCTVTIRGDTYEEALKSFKEEQRKQGWFIATKEEIMKKYH